VTWSVLDHDRRPKTGFRALADACQPVIVVADRPPPVVLAGDPLTLDIHVVSDRRDELKAAIVTARVTWPGGGHTWRWRGDIPPDSCVWVKALQLVVPDVDGRLLLELALDGPVRATNAYSAVIVGTT
jgi:beta-mannosidase